MRHNYSRFLVKLLCLLLGHKMKRTGWGTNSDGAHITAEYYSGRCSRCAYFISGLFKP